MIQKTHTPPSQDPEEPPWRVPSCVLLLLDHKFTMHVFSVIGLSWCSSKERVNPKRERHFCVARYSVCFSLQPKSYHTLREEVGQPQSSP